MEIVVNTGNSFVRLLPILEAELSEEEYKVVKREIGRIISTMDRSISAKIAYQFPDLAPEAVPIAHKIIQ